MRSTGLKLLLHDGFGIRLCAQRLYEGDLVRSGIARSLASLLSSCEFKTLLGFQALKVCEM
jgi:hypothetical protein